MNKNSQAPAGFWIRLVSRFIDMLIPGGLSIGLLFLLLEKKTNYEFKENYYYYIWTIVTIALILISFILVPFLSKGRTLGMFITKTKIVAEGSLLKTLIKREGFFSLGWVLMLIVAMAVINHTLVNDFARNDQKSISYSDTDKLRIGVVSAVGSLLIILQLLSVVGIIARRDKCGFHDRASNSKTVWTNKTLVEESQVFEKKIQPRLVKDEVVEWVTE